MAGDSLFWNTNFWLPRGYSWDDLVSKEKDIYYPQLRDILLQSVFVGVLLLVIRYLLERFVVIPIGLHFGLKRKKPGLLEKKPMLEDVYNSKRKLTQDDIKEACKKTGLPERQVQVWFRKRAKLDKPSSLQRFTECSFHLTFYLAIFIYGLVILWDKNWFWETKYCWKGYPKLTVTDDVYYYYLLELGFYWSLTFSLLTDHKRKDFVEMIVHHIVTMGLMYFSWVVNFVRIGTLVLLVHDAVDYWMAAAKMAKYIKYEQLCEVLFGVFAVVWVLTRLIIYPYRVIYSAWVESMEYLDFFPSHVFFNLLLIVLQILHILWTYSIFRILIQKFQYGELKKDVRSESEDDDDDNEEEDMKEKKTKSQENGKSSRPLPSGITTRSRFKGNSTE